MNEYDVSDAVRRWSYDPVLGPAARTLSNLVNAVNAKSDGWAYWPAPGRASRKLQDLLTSVARPRHNRTRQELAAEYKASLSTIKRFRTTSGINFEIEEVRGA